VTVTVIIGCTEKKGKASKYVCDFSSCPKDDRYLSGLYLDARKATNAAQSSLRLLLTFRH